MKFTDTVATMMALQSLMINMKSMYEQATNSLAEIPEPFRSSAITEIAEMGADWESSVRMKPSVVLATTAPKPAIESPVDTVGLPSVTQAILQLLAKHKEGLTTEQIKADLQGRFHTAADKPQRVIISTLSQMRANSKLLHDNGKFSLLPEPDGTASKTGPTLKDRVIEYFRDTDNRPATTLDLAKATGAHPNAIRSLFSVSHPTFESEPDPKPNTMKRWKLNDDVFTRRDSLLGGSKNN